MPNNHQQKRPYVSFLLVFVLSSIFGITVGTFYGPKVLETITQQPATTTPAENAYFEKGSPLDKRQLPGQTTSAAEKVILHGDRNKKEIALTFDAEMTDGMRLNVLSGKTSYDKRIVDTLNSTNTPATFFLTGMWVQLYPKDAQTIAHDPLFEIGSHSFADTAYTSNCFGLTQIPDTQDLEEIEATQKILHDLVGRDTKFFRFPGGCYSQTDLNVVTNTAGLTVVHWDVVAADGFNNNANLIARNVVDNAQNGSIVVMHLNGAPTAPKTADALPQIIQQLKDKGYTLVKVSDLLGTPAYN